MRKRTNVPSAFHRITGQSFAGEVLQSVPQPQSRKERGRGRLSTESNRILRLWMYQMKMLIRMQCMNRPSRDERVEVVAQVMSIDFDHLDAGSPPRT